MNPAHDRGWIHLHPAFLHHLSQVPVGDPILAVPTNANQDDRDWEPTTLEHELHANAQTNALMQQSPEFP